MNVPAPADMFDSSCAVVTAFVPGDPASQGSKNFLGTYKCKKTGRMRGKMAESSKKVPGWRADIRAALFGKLSEALQGGVRVDLVFYLQKPKSAPKTKPILPVKKPDIDKLARAVLDAIGSAGIWRDDSQVVEMRASKTYAEGSQGPGCLIAITEIRP